MASKSTGSSTARQHVESLATNTNLLSGHRPSLLSCLFLTTTDLVEDDVSRGLPNDGTGCPVPLCEPFVDRLLKLGSTAKRSIDSIRARSFGVDVSALTICRRIQEPHGDDGV